jgi:HAD superfamily, subfamily IIIB (Acid phosphatase)
VKLAIATLIASMLAGGGLALAGEPKDSTRAEAGCGRRRDGWKARTRRAIERRGHRIVVNVGDQRSDLDQGHALRAIKLPNPMYVIETA